MARSRRKESINVSIPEEAKHLTSATCRKCLRDRRLPDFYDATDKLLDTNGKMSVCRFCVKNIYEDFYVKNNDIYDGIYQTCKRLNVLYDTGAVEATQKYIDTLGSKGKAVDQVFGVYLGKLRSSKFGAVDIENEDFTFRENVKYTPDNATSLEDILDDVDDIRYLQITWGEGLELEDYQYLEEVYSRWTRTTDVDNYGIELLLRELCHKENEIRKARKANQPVDSLVKSLQELMKNSALTPALQNAASSGRSADAFGVWIKDIENLTPAEWYENDYKDKYKDIEEIEEYNEKFIKRSIRNFLTGSRDFNIEEILGISEESDEIDEE